MDATLKTPTPPERPDWDDPDAVDALALVRRIRDDLAVRTAGLGPEELIAFIRREAAVLGAVPGRAEARRPAA